MLRCGAHDDPLPKVMLCCCAFFYFSVFTSKSISPGHAEEGELVPKVKGLLLEYVCVVTIIDYV